MFVTRFLPKIVQKNGKFTVYPGPCNTLATDRHGRTSHLLQGGEGYTKLEGGQVKFNPCKKEGGR